MAGKLSTTNNEITNTICVFLLDLPAPSLSTSWCLMSWAASSGSESMCGMELSASSYTCSSWLTPLSYRCRCNWTADVMVHEAVAVLQSSFSANVCCCWCRNPDCTHARSWHPKHGYAILSSGTRCTDRSTTATKCLSVALSCCRSSASMATVSVDRRLRSRAPAPTQFSVSPALATSSNRYASDNGAPPGPEQLGAARWVSTPRGPWLSGHPAHASQHCNEKKKNR